MDGKQQYMVKGRIKKVVGKISDEIIEKYNLYEYRNEEIIQSIDLYQHIQKHIPEFLFIMIMKEIHYYILKELMKMFAS